MKRILTLIATIAALSADAQEIGGRMFDIRKEPVMLGAVLVKQNGVLKEAGISDYDGIYTAKPLEPGAYDITAFYGCYDTITITNVTVVAGERTYLNFEMTQSAGEPKHIVKPYKRKLVAEQANGRKTDAVTTSVAELTRLPDLYRYHHGCGAPRNVGCRTSGTLYIIDGVQMPVTEIQDLPMPELFIPHYLPVVRFTAKELTNIAATDLRDVVATVPRVYQPQRGTDVNIGGAGPYGTLYVVDGIQMAR